MGEKKRAKDLNRLAPQIKALLTGRKQICDFNEHDAVVIGRTFADFSSALGIMMAFNRYCRSEDYTIKECLAIIEEEINANRKIEPTYYSIFEYTPYTDIFYMKMCGCDNSLTVKRWKNQIIPSK